MKIGIIGAGISGLAAAVRLASQGHEVEVFEANSYPGGKLSAFEQDGYRFDAGPSLFTMPAYVEDLFRTARTPIEGRFKYIQVPITCNYFWNDGTQLTAWADTRRFAAEAERILGVPARRVLDYLALSAKKYRLAGHIFLEKSLHRWDTWLSANVLKALTFLPGFDLFTSMHQVNERWFGHPKLVQLFDRYATYNGSNPYKAPGMLTIIPHFEHNLGVYYPEGGMHSITQAVFGLAQQLGVRFHFGQRVEAITTDRSRVTGLRTAEGVHRFQAVVSNMDVYYTYKRLMPEEKAPERILRQPKSTSALIFYWGVRQAFPQLDLHNIFFSERYQEEFEALERGEIIDDPTVYINITSKYTPTDAPPGCENWFVMINAPSHRGQDWAALIERVRNEVIAKLDRLLGVNLRALIDTEAILSPPEIEAKTSSHLGALYGYSSNTQMAAFLRHANFSRRIRGLYFCGGSVHPGGGIPLCLLSAKITSELIGLSSQS
ncbi:MAG: 1-hydroxycarotenoid 3,4-desaturase CrtD [Saprospiraceae bacterium]|nr:phytoene desaturase family protein [Saprospiraceae bacterium]MDW8230695.1 1-hydroxycarotenoid 3,4-desaturase CrtD [Saprospiraceae bacterium]